MLISLLLLNATKWYVRFVCFGYSLSVEHVCIVFFYELFILYCIAWCINILISGCCKSCLQPSMLCSTAWLLSEQIKWWCYVQLWRRHNLTKEPNAFIKNICSACYEITLTIITTNTSHCKFIFFSVVLPRDAERTVGRYSLYRS